jgi:tetratricopeptide (TPR) repeat protein
MKVFRMFNYIALIGVIVLSKPVFSEDYEFSLLPPAVWVGSTLKGVACHGGLNPYYGPYDYSNPDHFENKLEVVEVFHFTPKVETLAGGESSATAAGDIDYTLLSFPNHHRALYALMRMKMTGHDDWMRDAKMPPPECYFQRAMQFSPDDHTVQLVFGVYLQQFGHADKAFEYFKRAEKLAPSDPEPPYNMGLYYFSKKNYKKSLEYAKKAYALNHPLPKLKNKLAKVGHWK